MRREERCELAAFLDLFAAAPVAFAARAARVGGALCMVAPRYAAAVELNRAVGLGLDAVASEAELDELLAFFAAAGVPACVQVAPGARPSDLPRWLAARGLAAGYAWQKFARRAVPLPPPEVALRVAEAGPGEGAVFGATFAAGYGLPAELGEWVAGLPGRVGWHCFLAWEGGEPAAAASLYVDGDTGWLGMAATRPEQRRRGAQRALLGVRIARAAEVGCSMVVTETGVLQQGRPSNSYRNILAAGFEPAYVRANWRPHASERQ